MLPAWYDMPGNIALNAGSDNSLRKKDDAPCTLDVNLDEECIGCEPREVAWKNPASLRRRLIPLEYAGEVCQKI
jgi:hypothetical protein